MRRRWLTLICIAVFAGLSLAIPAVWRLLDREPMIGFLPARYQTESFDIWRWEGGIDFAMCMRVALSLDEVATFIPMVFDQKSNGVAIDVADVSTSCDAQFWPDHFETKTIAFKLDDPGRPGLSPEGGMGAVYERGHLYFWEYSY